MEGAIGLVGLEVRLEGVRELPGEAGVDPPELDRFDVGPVFEEELRIRERSGGDHAAGGAGGVVHLQVQGNHRAVAAHPVHVDALLVVLLVAVQRVNVEVQVVVGPEFEAGDGVVAVAAAELIGRAAEAGNQGVIDLLDREPRVVGQQERVVDRSAGRETVARIRGNRPGNRPVADSGGVAHAGGGWAARLVALRGRELRVRIPDRLEPLHVQFVTDASRPQQGAKAVVPRVAEDDRAALAPAGALVLRSLGPEGDVGAGIVEWPRAAHVDGAGGSALDHFRRRTLVNRELREQLRRQHVEVDFAVGVLRIGGARGGDRDGRAIQQHSGEIRAQAADRDVRALTVDVAGDRDARNAVEGFGDVGVGEFADIFRVDLVDEPDRLALRIGGLGQALAVPGDDDFLQIARGGLARCRLRILGLGGCSGSAQTEQTHRRMRVCLSIFHDIPLEIGKL